MTEKKIRCPKLHEIAAQREKDGLLADLEVERGETRVLAPTSASMKRYFANIAVGSIAELKSIVGVPDRLRLPTGWHDDGEDERYRRDQPDIPAKRVRLGATIDPAVLTRPSDDAERVEAVRIARAELERHLYANMPLASASRDLVLTYLQMRRPVVFAAVLGNLTVQDGATLHISPGTLVLYANRVRMFGSGRIVCSGPTTFDVQNIQGNIKSGGIGIADDFVSGPIQPVFP